MQAATADGTQQRTWYALGAAALVLLVAAPLLALAPACEDPRAVALTADIARRAHDAAPYLARGAYFEASGSPRLAEADFDTAARLAGGLPAADLARARLFLETGRTGPAERALARYLERRPDDEDALRLRSRARRESGELPAGGDAVALAHASAAR